MVAVAHTGAVKLKLDEFTTKVAVFDVHWQSEDASAAADRYELDVSSGVVNFELDTYSPKVERIDVPASEPKPEGKAASALDILLDGVEARLKSRQS